MNPTRLARAMGAGIIGVVALAGAAPGPAAAAAGEAGPGPELDYPPTIRRLFDVADALDLADPRTQLEASRGDGSSCYLKVGLPDATAPGKHRIWGVVIAEHAGTLVPAEVFHFTLATLLGVGDREGPARALTLSGAARDRYVQVIAAADYRHDAFRSKNQRLFLRYAAGHPTLEAVAKPWGPPPQDAAFLIKGDAFNQRHALARFLRADEAQPSGAAMSFPGIAGTSTERALARELSDIFVIDALTNQRDRFSGGNLPLISVPSAAGTEIHFVSYDNGDALDDPDPKWIGVYLHLVTRFDRALASRLGALDHFLREGGTFAGFRTEADLRRALGLDRQPGYWDVFKRNLRLLVAHVQSVQGAKYFDD